MGAGAAMLAVERNRWPAAVTGDALCGRQPRAIRRAQHLSPGAAQPARPPTAPLSQTTSWAIPHRRDVSHSSRPAHSPVLRWHAPLHGTSECK